MVKIDNLPESREYVKQNQRLAYGCSCRGKLLLGFSSAFGAEKKVE
jgi:hypothetical protein